MSRRSFAAVRPDMALLVAKVPEIRSALRTLGVAADDLADVVQEVLLGAWRSIQTGRFCPSPDVPLDVVLSRWLFGVAWRLASHYHAAAWRRREVPSAGLAEEAAPTASPEARVDARNQLAELEGLRADQREALLLRVAGFEYRDIGARQRVPWGTAANRVRIARQRFRALTKRRER